MKLMVIFIIIELSLTPNIKADAECAEPEPPSNGRKQKLNATTVGYFCIRGFVLHGNSMSVCVNGEWSPTGQTCEVKNGDNQNDTETEDYDVYNSTTTNATLINSQNEVYNEAEIHNKNIVTAWVIAGGATLIVTIIIAIVYWRCSKVGKSEQKKEKKEVPANKNTRKVSVNENTIEVPIHPNQIQVRYSKIKKEVSVIANNCVNLASGSKNASDHEHLINPA